MRGRTVRSRGDREDFATPGQHDQPRTGHDTTRQQPTRLSHPRSTELAQGGRRQVGEMDGTANVVSEWDTISGTGRKAVCHAYVHRLLVADDQRGPGDGGIRVHETHPCPRCGLRHAVRSGDRGRAGSFGRGGRGCR